MQSILSSRIFRQPQLYYINKAIGRYPPTSLFRDTHVLAKETESLNIYVGFIVGYRFNIK